MQNCVSGSEAFLRPRHERHDRAVSGVSSLKIELEGTLTFEGAAELWSRVREQTATLESGTTLDFDASRLESVDGGTMALPPW